MIIWRRNGQLSSAHRTFRDDPTRTLCGLKIPETAETIPYDPVRHENARCRSCLRCMPHPSVVAGRG